MLSILLFTLLPLLLWVAAGTATYRRLGGYRLAHLPAHTNKCGGPHIRIKGGRSFRKCSECNEYLDLIKGNPSYRPYAAHINDCGKCICTEDERRESAMSGLALRSYTLWPAYVVAYGVLNAQKAYVNAKGEDYSFFIEPKMVQTKTERQASLDADMSRLQAELEGLDKRIKAVQ